MSKQEHNIEITIRRHDGFEIVGNESAIFKAIKNADNLSHYLVKLTDNGIVKYIDNTASNQPLIRVGDNYFLLCIPNCMNNQELEAVRLLNATATVGNWINQC